MFRIKLAETAAELDAAFQLRHRVFVEQEGYLPARPGGRIVDHFDGFPGVGHIIAVHDGRVVGDARFMEDCGAGTGPDDYFDFRPHLPAAAKAPGARVGGGNWLSIERSARRVPRLCVAILAMGYRWCIERGMTHVKIAANPDAMPVLGSTGFQQIAPRYFDEKHGVPAIPMLLDLARMGDRYTALVQAHLRPQLLTGFDRQFHAAGEDICASPEELLLVVQGTVALHDGRGVRARLGVGDLLPAAGGHPFAETDVDLMVVGRASFEAQVAACPSIATRILIAAAPRWSGDAATPPAVAAESSRPSFLSLS